MLAELAVAPGFFTEDSDRGAKGRWKDGDHVRFRNRIPEKIGGWALVSLSGAQTVGEAAGKILGAARSRHDWTALDDTKFMAIGTHWKLYLVNGTTLYDITPIRESGTLTDPFTTTNGSDEVTVADTGHGFSVNEFANFSGASAVGGITIDGNYQVIEVVNANTYKIRHSSAATSSASGGGSVDYEYEIAIGLSGEETTSGYGVGAYGTGSWDTPRPISGDTATQITQIRIWSLDNWGEDLIASPRGQAVYVWDRTNGPTTRATLISSAPSRANRVLVGQEERILIGLGCHDGSVFDQLLVKWSDREDYDTWTAAFTNRAGDKRLNGGSRIITGVKTRREILIFTDTTVHSMQFVGGNDVYGFTTLAQHVGIAGPEAAAEVNGVVFFMGLDEFYIYDGTVRVLQCDVRSHVFGNLNRAKIEKVVASVNSLFNEVWWYYPTTLGNENSAYVVYNYRDNTWVFGTIDRSAVGDYSAYFKKPYGIRSDGKLFKHETGLNDADSDGNVISLDSRIESYDLELGQGDQFAHVRRLIPDYIQITGDAAVTLKGRRYPQADQYEKGPYAVDGTTDKLDVRIRARQIALLIEQTGINKTWRMGGWRADVRAHGRR